DADEGGQAVAAGVGDPAAYHLYAALAGDGEFAFEGLAGFVHQPVADAHATVSGRAGHGGERQAVGGEQGQHVLGQVGEGDVRVAVTPAVLLHDFDGAVPLDVG